VRHSHAAVTGGNRAAKRFLKAHPSAVEYLDHFEAQHNAEHEESEEGHIFRADEGMPPYHGLRCQEQRGAQGREMTQPAPAQPVESPDAQGKGHEVDEVTQIGR
jgi:hypothetical protein